MCDKPDFDRAQDEATKLLLRQNINSLCVDIRSFKFNQKILIDSIQNYSNIVNRPASDFVCNKFSGCCVIPNSHCNLVLFDDSERNDCRKHWGIVHEVGHIYLGHTVDGKKEEIEAHFFAAQVVMPEIVLCNLSARCGGLDPYLLTDTFNASLESSCKRIGTLRRRFGFNASKFDKALLAKFRPILDKDFDVERNKSFWDKLCSAS